MLVKVIYLKDHSGYKKGQEWAMLLNYAERFQREGVVRIVDGDVDRWVLPPQPEEEEEPTEPQEEEGSFMRFFNNKNK